MGKIAAELGRALAQRRQGGGRGQTAARVLAEGAGWSITDVICTSGPRDRPFEERHTEFRIAAVFAGSFQYRSARGVALMSPGSLLLGSLQDSFECAHDHGSGDRCLAFGYSPGYFERLAAAIPGAHSPNFPIVYLPPLRTFSPLITRAAAGLAGWAPVAWEELSIQMAAAVIYESRGLSPVESPSTPAATARVTGTVRMIEQQPDGKLSIGTMARDAGLSPYHFLRTFQSVTRVTPHQYIMRARLREAAMHLLEESSRQIVDIALDCGFEDLSNFNHAFRAEFGFSPRGYRRQMISSGH